MNTQTSPLQLGKLTLPNRVIYSPLAGCSDYPFRKMAVRYRRPGLIYCEMVKMEPLVRQDGVTYHLLDYSEDMHPIGAQICGSNPKLAGPAARIIESMGFDVIDLNCGCPVDKVTKDGSGSGLLKNPERIGEIVSNMVAAVDIPVTIKVRAGWDEENINVAEVTRIAEEAGAVAIAVHGRTRKQAYKGGANWDWVRQSVEASKTIKVFGNGDVFSPEAAAQMFDQTGCDAVLVSRATMGQPWIAEDILRHLQGEEAIERTHEDYLEALQAHFELICAYHNDRRTCVDMRRVGCWYSKGVEGKRTFRQKISRASSISEVQELVAALSHAPSGDLLCQ